MVEAQPNIDVDLEQTSALLRALADPTRLRIVAALRQGETCVCELASSLDLAENLVSHHLAVLRRLGLAVDRRDASDGRWIYYQLDPTVLGQAQQMLFALLDPATLGTREPLCPRPTALMARARHTLPVLSGNATEKSRE